MWILSLLSVLLFFCLMEIFLFNRMDGNFFFLLFHEIESELFFGSALKVRRANQSHAYFTHAYHIVNWTLCFNLINGYEKTKVRLKWNIKWIESIKDIRRNKENNSVFSKLIVTDRSLRFKMNMIDARNDSQMKCTGKCTWQKWCNDVWMVTMNRSNCKQTTICDWFTS